MDKITKFRGNLIILVILVFSAACTGPGAAIPLQTGASTAAVQPSLPPAPLQPADPTPTPTLVMTPTQPVVTKNVNSAGIEYPADAAPLDKQVLRLVGVEGEYLSWDASIYNRSPGGIFGIHDSCTRTDKDFNLLPAGCESWDSSSDGLTWTFKISADKTWSDGKPVTVDDWVFTIQRYARKGYDGESLYRKAAILNWNFVVSGETDPAELGIKKVNDTSFSVTTEKPIAFIPQLFSMVWVVPKHIVKDRLADGNWALDPQKAVSAGPYRLDHYTKGKEIVWTANERYIGPTPPLLEKIIYRFASTQERLGLFKSGDLDVIGGSGKANLTNDEMGKINGDEALKGGLVSWTGLQTTYLFFDTWNVPFDYNVVRGAFAKIQDREKLVAGGLNYPAVPAYGMNPPGFPGSDTGGLKKNLTYDPAMAVWMMNKAGYQNGKDFPKLKLYIRSGNSDISTVAGMIAERLQSSFNISVTVEELEDEAYTQKLAQQKSKGGDLLLGLDTYEAQFIDGSEMLSLWGGCIIQGVTKRRMLGRYPWYYAQFNEDVCKARSAVADEEQRNTLYKNAEKILAITDPGLVPLYHPQFNMLVSSTMNITGLEPGPDRNLNLLDQFTAGDLSKMYRKQ